MFASAQTLDFLELAENISFPDQKLKKFSAWFPDENRPRVWGKWHFPFERRRAFGILGRKGRLSLKTGGLSPGLP
jgi:hypothetical protein